MDHDLSYSLVGIGFGYGEGGARAPRRSPPIGCEEMSFTGPNVPSPCVPPMFMPLQCSTPFSQWQVSCDKGVPKMFRLLSSVFLIGLMTGGRPANAQAP